MLVLSCTVLATSLITVASAAVLAPLQPRLSDLHSRQTQFLVPAQCLPACNLFVDTVNACLTAACACTTHNLNLGIACVACAAAESQIPSDVALDQMVLNNYAEECALKGFPLNVPTVKPSRTVQSPSANAPARSTATAAQPTTAIPTGYVPQTDSTSSASSFVGFASPTDTNAGGGGGGGVTPSTTFTPQFPTTGAASGAMGVGNRAKALRVLLFNVCLTVVFVA